MTSGGINCTPEESCDSLYSGYDQDDDDEDEDDEDINNKSGDTCTDPTVTPYLKVIKDQSILRGNTAVKELKELIESVKSSGKSDKDDANPKNDNAPTINSEMDIDFVPTEDCFTEEVPRLEMVEEPEEAYRARYQSEGCRGPIHGASENGFPTVKVTGYVGKVVMTVFLVTRDGEPHLHAITGPGSVKAPCKEVILPGKIPGIQMWFGPEQNMAAIWDCLSVRRIRNWEADRQLRERGEDPAAWKNKKKEARLMFQATIPQSAKRPGYILTCQSRPFLCTAPSGVPEIWWISETECSAKGGKEIALVGKKFSAGFRVRFFHCDSDGPWECYAEVEKSKSHQGAIVLKVPQYKDGLIEESFTVQIEVRVGPDKDRRCSDSIDFKYVTEKSAEKFEGLCPNCASVKNALTQLFGKTPESMSASPVPLENTTENQGIEASESKRRHSGRFPASSLEQAQGDSVSAGDAEMNDLVTVSKDGTNKDTNNEYQSSSAMHIPSPKTFHNKQDETPPMQLSQRSETTAAHDTISIKSVSSSNVTASTEVAVENPTRGEKRQKTEKVVSKNVPVVGTVAPLLPNSSLFTNSALVNLLLQNQKNQSVTLSHQSVTMSTPAQQSSTLAHQPVAMTHQPVARAHQSVTLPHQTVTLAHQPVTMAHQPVTLAHQPVTLAHQPVTLAHQPVTLAHQPVTLAHQPVTLPSTKVINLERTVQPTMVTSLSTLSRPGVAANPAGQHTSFVQLHPLQSLDRIILASAKAQEANKLTKPTLIPSSAFSFMSSVGQQQQQLQHHRQQLDQQHCQVRQQQYQQQHQPAIQFKILDTQQPIPAAQIFNSQQGSSHLNLTPYAFHMVPASMNVASQLSHVLKTSAQPTQTSNVILIPNATLNVNTAQQVSVKQEPIGMEIDNCALVGSKYQNVHIGPSCILSSRQSTMQTPFVNPQFTHQNMQIITPISTPSSVVMTGQPSVRSAVINDNLPKDTSSLFSSSGQTAISTTKESFSGATHVVPQQTNMLNFEMKAIDAALASQGIVLSVQNVTSLGQFAISHSHTPLQTNLTPSQPHSQSQYRFLGTQTNSRTNSMNTSVYCVRGSFPSSMTTSHTEATCHLTSQISEDQVTRNNPIINSVTLNQQTTEDNSQKVLTRHGLTSETVSTINEPVVPTTAAASDLHHVSTKEEPTPPDSQTESQSMLTSQLSRVTSEYMTQSKELSNAAQAQLQSLQKDFVANVEIIEHAWQKATTDLNPKSENDQFPFAKEGLQQATASNVSAQDTEYPKSNAGIKQNETSGNSTMTLDQLQHLQNQNNSQPMDVGQQQAQTHHQIPPTNQKENISAFQTNCNFHYASHQENSAHTQYVSGNPLPLTSDRVASVLSGIVRSNGDICRDTPPVSYISLPQQYPLASSQWTSQDNQTHVDAVPVVSMPRIQSTSGDPREQGLGNTPSLVQELTRLSVVGGPQVVGGSQVVGGPQVSGSSFFTSLPQHRTLSFGKDQSQQSGNLFQNSSQMNPGSSGFGVVINMNSENPQPMSLTEDPLQYIPENFSRGENNAQGSSTQEIDTAAYSNLTDKTNSNISYKEQSVDTLPDTFNDNQHRSYEPAITPLSAKDSFSTQHNDGAILNAYARAQQIADSYLVPESNLPNQQPLQSIQNSQSVRPIEQTELSGVQHEQAVRNFPQHSTNFESTQTVQQQTVGPFVPGTETTNLQNDNINIQNERQLFDAKQCLPQTQFVTDKSLAQQQQQQFRSGCVTGEIGLTQNAPSDNLIQSVNSINTYEQQQPQHPEYEQQQPQHQEYEQQQPQHQEYEQQQPQHQEYINSCQDTSNGQVTQCEAPTRLEQEWNNLFQDTQQLIAQGDLNKGDAQVIAASVRQRDSLLLEMYISSKTDPSVARLRETLKHWVTNIKKISTS